jgi:hypothetical protein
MSIAEPRYMADSAGAWVELAQLQESRVPPLAAALEKRRIPYRIHAPSSVAGTAMTSASTLAVYVPFDGLHLARSVLAQVAAPRPDMTVTRQLCASAVLAGGIFRRRVLDAVDRKPTAAAPEIGIDVPLVT